MDNVVLEVDLHTHDEWLHVVFKAVCNANLSLRGAHVFLL